MNAALFFAVGFYALLCQVVLFREMAVVFLGHELTLGLMLASWLLWGGLGSFIHSKKTPSDNSLSIHLAWLALAPPGTVLLVRLAKLLVPFGNLPGLLYTLGSSLALLFLPCWPIGAVFRIAASLAEEEGRERAGAKLYLAESAGGFAGGLVLTYFLLGTVPGLTMVCTASVLLLLLGWTLVRPKLWLVPAAALLASVVLLGAAGSLDAWSRNLEFRGFGLTEQGESRYEHLAIGEAGSLKLFFQNGVLSAQFPDAATQEEMIHWPLLAHPKPERVLALGASSLPSVGEILKHPSVRALDIVEKDAAAVALVRQALPEMILEQLKRPGVRVHERDARRWIASHPGAYDVVLHTIPEPLNAGLNRLFTREFFLAAGKALRPGGILALSVPSAANYLTSEIAYTNASILRTLRSVFPDTAIIARKRMVLLAGVKQDALSHLKLAERYEKRGIRNTVVVPSNFPYFLNESRARQVEMRLKEIKSVELNTDLNPVSYFYTWKVWLSMFVTPAHFVGLCAAVFALLFGLSRLWKLARSRDFGPESLLILAAGSASMAVEVVLLMLFQSLSGAMYWQLGALLGAFMAGLSMGCGIFSWARLKFRWPNLALKGCVLLFGALCLALSFHLHTLSEVFPESRLQLFACLLAINGFLVGVAFPLALQVEGQKAPALYGADLWGAAGGAFLTGAFLVPLLGMALTLTAAGILLLLATMASFVIKTSLP